MSWSPLQRVVFLRACADAGWNDARRYLAMRHAGCPQTAERRPSVKHARNSQGMFEACMVLAEACAGAAGRSVRPPNGHVSWREAAASGRQRLANLARCIAAEAVERMPETFDAGLLGYAVSHTTVGDDPELCPIRPVSIEECDAGQLVRVVELLRAFVGRRFAAACVRPRTFEVPPGAAIRARANPAGMAAIT